MPTRFLIDIDSISAPTIMICMLMQPIIRWFAQKENVIPLIVVLALTLFSFSWLLGYSVYDGDQLIYFPSILKHFDSSLYKQDLIFGQDAFTLFDDVIIWGVEKTGHDMAFVVFFMTLITRFVFFYALYRITRYFTGDQKFSLFALLIFVSGFVVYGAGMRTIAFMLLPRDIATAFGLLSLSFLMARRRMFAAIALGVGIIFHPTMSLPFILLFYCSFFFSREWKEQKFASIISGLIPLLFVGLLLSAIPTGKGPALFQVLDAEWLKVVLRRDPYYFLSTWYYPNSAPLYGFMSIYFFVLLVKEYGKIYLGERRKYLFLCFFIPVGLALLSFVLSDFFKILFFIQASFGRSFLLWKLVLNMLFTFYAYEHIKKNPRDWLYNFLLCAIIASFILTEKMLMVFVPAQGWMWIARAYARGAWAWMQQKWVAILVLALTAPVALYFAVLHETGGLFEYMAHIIVLAIAGALCMVFARNFIRQYASVEMLIFMLLFGTAIGLPWVNYRPGALSDPKFVEMCEWAKQNTDKNALFFVEPFTSVGGEFRLLCERSVFATRKDGGQVIFNREYAMEWNRRYDLIKELDGNQGALLPAINQYGIDYVVADNDRALMGMGQKVFDNGRFIIYRFAHGNQITRR